MGPDPGRVGAKEPVPTSSWGSTVEFPRQKWSDSLLSSYPTTGKRDRGRAAVQLMSSAIPYRPSHGLRVVARARPFKPKMMSQLRFLRRAVLHTVGARFVSFTMDTGDIPSGYVGGDLEAEGVVALARAVRPGYLRLSVGAADSLGYRPDSAAPEAEQGQIIAAAGKHCEGGDCGNCDAANSPGGPPLTVLPNATLWFNESSWRRINTFSAASALDGETLPGRRSMVD